jgi:hypothetical protein
LPITESKLRNCSSWPGLSLWQFYRRNQPSRTLTCMHQVGENILT